MDFNKWVSLAFLAGIAGLLIANPDGTSKVIGAAGGFLTGITNAAAGRTR